MVLHDFSDPLLEIAKLALYAKKQLLADVAFACFAGAFIWTRLWFYPLYIIGSLWYDSLEDDRKLANHHHQGLSVRCEYGICSIFPNFRCFASSFASHAYHMDWHGKLWSNLDSLWY